VLKAAVIGGGSTYTPELVSGFLAFHERFPLDELWLHDVDPARLEIVGGFARRLAAAKGSPFRVVLSTDRREALQQADYVLTQLRVGQMEARRQDEYLGWRHGLIGQETTGVGGMAKALRTIPVLLEIAAGVKELSKPGALLVNFTNPAGLVTQALSLHAPDVPSLGVCNVPITAKMKIIEGLEEALGRKIDPARAALDSLGLNHLSWHRGFTLDGEDLWPQVMQKYLLELEREESPEWDVPTVRAQQMIPNYYLQYYCFTEKKLKEQQSWPPSRADEVIEIEKALLAQYADPDLVELPPEMMKRGGAWYSTMAVQLLASHYGDTGEMHIVNLRQGGAVPGWPADWVLEMPASVRRAAITPLPAAPLLPAQAELVARVKAYELLVVEAAVTGSREAARQALLAHPLGPSAEQVGTVLDDLLLTNRPYLPKFWKE
jgi:6-phospho-beta-glucosidase